MMNMPILLHDHTSKDGSYLRSVQRYHHKQLLTCTQEGKMRPAFSRHKKTQSSAVRMREAQRHVSSRVCLQRMSNLLLQPAPAPQHLPAFPAGVALLLRHHRDAQLLKACQRTAHGAELRRLTPCRLLHGSALC